MSLVEHELRLIATGEQVYGRVIAYCPCGWVFGSDGINRERTSDTQITEAFLTHRWGSPPPTGPEPRDHPEEPPYGF